MRNLVCFLAVVAILALPLSAAAAAVKGINVALLPPGKSSLTIDPASPKPEDIAALQKYNAKRIDVVASGGFNLVRLRFRMSLIRPGASPQQRDLALQAMTDCVRRANAKGITTLIALFPENGHDQHDLLCDKQDEFLQTIDLVVRELPDTSLVGLEPLNEPFTGCGPPDSPKRWINLQRVIYQRLRSVRPHAIFVVSGDNWGGDLLKLDPAPYRADGNVLFSLHFYDPMLFTSQGVSWNFLPPYNRYIHDLPWPYRSDAVEQVRADAMARIDADPSLDTAKRATLKSDLSEQLAAYAESGTDRALARSLDRLADWATSHGIPATRVFLGEFGVIRPSQDTRGRITPGAAAWIGTVAKLADERGFQWALWDLDTSFAIGFGHQGDADKITDEIAKALR